MPGVTPEPILDVVRGLSTIASFAIVVGQVKNIYDAFFVGECSRCRGAGILTCPHCHGTKTLRSRPGYLRTRDFDIVDDARDSYLCIYCGPPCQYDFDPFQEDDEDRALQVQENVKWAVANRFPRPIPARPTAGTVHCPSCLGDGKINRLTPDFAKGLGLEPAWDSKIAARVGRWFWGRAARPADKKRLFLEYPSAPVKSPIELPCPSAATMSPGEEEALKRELERLEKGGVGAGKQYGIDDYILPYASDDERS